MQRGLRHAAVHYLSATFPTSASCRRKREAATSRKSIEVAKSLPGVVWIRSYVSDVEGKIYCEYEAPDAETILQHARKVGLPADKISEVSMEVSPAMFV